MAIVQNYSINILVFHINYMLYFSDNNEYDLLMYFFTKSFFMRSYAGSNNPITNSYLCASLRYIQVTNNDA
ncbi:hypothetical protein SAMN06265348_10284 [Pedobacter westerhofensis]|uniref:Uncharacterized protein n=1 Tax=Pedobacter westerhofensis TaxID=425512 RepID=A0A521B8D7_9SPHI|nr:hypothetical protein SAMN06265348_10284 [Pedobacter westerhofensis]